MSSLSSSTQLHKQDRGRNTAKFKPHLLHKQAPDHRAMEREHGQGRVAFLHYDYEVQRQPSRPCIPLWYRGWEAERAKGFRKVRAVSTFFSAH